MRSLQQISEPAQLAAAIGIDYVDANHSYSGNAQNDAVSEQYKPYHNGIHSRFVLADTLRACDVLELSGLAKDIAGVAAAHHDAVFDLDGTTNGRNEEESTEIYKQTLERVGITQKLFYEYGRLAIVGTIVDQSESLHKQKATEQEYPSKLAERIALATAAGDMGRIFAPEGPLLGHGYHKELTTGASGIKPAIDEALLKFQRQQILLLRGNYVYPNLDLARAFTTHRQEVCDYADQVYADLQAGNISSWDELIASDLDFMRQHS